MCAEANDKVILRHILKIKYYKEEIPKPKTLYMYICNMKNLIVISIIFILCACNKSNQIIKERISNADSVAINYFKGYGTLDTVLAVKIIKD